MKAVWLGRLSDANAALEVVKTEFESRSVFLTAVIQAFIYFFGECQSYCMRPTGEAQ